MTEEKPKNFMSGKHWIIVIIILISGYGIYSGATDLQESTNQKWTDESADILTQKCLTDSKDMAVKYPGLTKEYCECSTAKIQAEFTQAEYIEIAKGGIEKQKQILLPVFQNCLTNYQEKIKNYK